ncbi:MAG: PEP-CTERM sorting domain-containing protein [Gammaproteobacteria bacterium]|nr:PEP-CTERM sorting domain-containing protein [Gammaproteobacteria bacterium]MCP5199684.1 PEP-CTERM sorting domain-containing protein [Gammaproteobacteria bacterium]
MKQASAKLFAVAIALLLLPIASQATYIASTGDGLSVIVTSTANVIAKYKGNSAAYSNDLYLVGGGAGGSDLFIFNNHASAVGSTVDLGSFAIGTELIFRLHVNNTGYDYFTGPATRNPDSHVHARVQSSGLPSPEFAAGESLVSFEDLYDGPFVFNDLGFSFTNTVADVPNRVPEPTTLGLLAAGLVGATGRRYRKKA